jgi:hypothetical protein
MGGLEPGAAEGQVSLHAPMRIDWEYFSPEPRQPGASQLSGRAFLSVERGVFCRLSGGRDACARGAVDPAC